MGGIGDDGEKGFGLLVSPSSEAEERIPFDGLMPGYFALQSEVVYFLCDGGGTSESGAASWCLSSG
jgi:hypothetical protein